MAAVDVAPSCQVCGRTAPAVELTPAALLRRPLARMIAGEVAGWSAHSFLCREHLDGFRSTYIQRLLEDELGEVSTLRAVGDRPDRQP